MYPKTRNSPSTRNVRLLAGKRLLRLYRPLICHNTAEAKGQFARAIRWKADLH